MAAYNPHSPRARARALDPITPLHSPHHSANSSISSRTPIHTLTLHEYRKQQNSPASQITSTPTGKTLRRKAAAPALQTVERVSSISASRPLHFSQSAHQLSYQALPPSPPPFAGQQHLLDQPLRSQSAEPYGQGGGASHEAVLDIGKVGNFKRIKRLPKRPAATGIHIPPPPLTNVTPPYRRLSPLQTTSFPSVENTNPSDSQSTPSTFSLSRFPQPPHFVDPPLSPPDAALKLRLNTASFTATAPATPPATPAVIHYRGASFDLVNPHESLWFHDIETPSREFDSTDCLPLPSLEDLALSEMAPKRALYGDFGSAYTSIARRSPDVGSLDLPLPPTPVAYTPGSSQYSSPFHSPDSNAVSPLTLKPTDNESRWSLKHLTRNLTKNLSRSPKLEQGSEEELKDLSRSHTKRSTPRKDFPESHISPASATFDGEFPRPLTESYRVYTPKSTETQNDPPTPTSPLDRAMDVMSGSDAFMGEHSRLYSHHYSSEPLTSMVPDEPSTQVGLASDTRPSASYGDMDSKPYYDDLQSLYPSSSIYTGDDPAHSQYSPSLASNRKSNPFLRMSADADAFADEYKSDALYRYSSSRRTSRRTSRPLTQEMFHRSLQKQGNNKTDTISKFIDEYKQVESTSGSQPALEEEESSEQAGMVTSTSGAFQDPSMFEQSGSRVDSDLSRIQFDVPHSQEATFSDEANAPTTSGSFALQPMGHHIPGAPPRMAAPLASAFEYDDMYQAPRRDKSSEMFSGISSYGDTRQLLQLSQPMYPGHGLEPSSSYSQPEAPPTPQTPQEALDLADQIFEDAATDTQEEGIPAMWARRGSGNLLRSRSQIDNASLASKEQLDFPSPAGDEEVFDQDGGDWETVADKSQPGRLSGRLSPGESIADYSTSEGSSRDSLGFSSSSLPVFEDEPLEPGSFQFQYQTPSPMPAHQHPFNSSPPQLLSRTSVRSAPNENLPSSPVSSPPVALTVPAFITRYDPDTSSPQPTYSTPNWLNPMGLSDQQTQELLLSGPNEEILYDDDDGRMQSHGESDSEPGPSHSYDTEPPTSSPVVSHGLERQNTFDKFTVVGPQGNLTGTPQGTGMNDAGSSAADNSSPGAFLSSTPPESRESRRRVLPSGPYASLKETMSRTVSVQPGPSSFATPMRARLGSGSSPGEPGFYTSPNRRASVTRVTPGLIRPTPSEHEKSPSQVSLFPPPPAPERLDSKRRSRNSFRSSGRPRLHSRAAVPGQTKLRHMVLAPDAQSVSSTRDSDISRLIRTAESGRPSTSNTHTPLRLQRSVSTMRTIIAYEHSPHLLCPERAEDPEEEVQRRKLSWWIFAMFCILPPMLILYRWFGDLVIVNVTKGRLHHVSAKPKRVALGVGIAVNLGLSSAILLPILIAHAMGVL